MDEFEQHDFLDEFEMQFSEELELLNEQDPAPSCRRGLTLNSPFLPACSRKRPLEDSPLPFASPDLSDRPKKRLKDNVSAIACKNIQSLNSKSDNCGESQESTEVSLTDISPIKRTTNQISSHVSHAKTVSSCYSLPASPSPPHSPSPTVEDNRTQETKARTYRSKYTSDISVSLLETPTKRKIPASNSSQTPSSSGKYQRVLELDGDIDVPSYEDYSRFARKSLLERYEDTYRALKNTHTDDELTYASDESSEDTALELTSSVSVSRNQPSHQYVLTRAPPGSCITVTSSNGRRVYLRCKPALCNEVGRSHSRFQLLSVPFTELKATVEEERRRKLIEQSDELLRSLTSAQEESGTQMLFDGSDDTQVGALSKEYALWVDKYSPKLFTELLSDDGINRTLLSWLKLWDGVVYGRTVPLKASGVVGASSVGTKGTRKTEEKRFSQSAKGKKFEKRIEYQDPATFAAADALDETQRPRIKLALLCGAPGLGKTTLAHVIAQHAGYNVIEMNASDDRSPEVFQRKIESSTQMQAVLTPATKPNCLIIDEIDGAPAASISVLIDFIKKKEGTAKKKKGNTLLSRPIICICNDQYAPSLRQLRQHALVLYFPPTITSRLATRLHQVVKKERMSAAMSTLIALCEKTENDIRSCLNTLQFLGRQRKDLTLSVVQSTNIGQKDAQRSLFSLWKDIFQLPVVKKHTLNQGPLKIQGKAASNVNGGNLGTNFIRFYNIYLASAACGEFEKVANGLFENYLHIRFKDPNMEAISVAQDWLVFHDCIQKYIAQSQDYSFIPYMPYLPVAFHFLFAAPSRPQIVYPNTGYEMFQRHQYSLHLLSSLLMDMPAAIKRTVTSTLLVTEVLPPLCEIITPSFRPVSLQLYSSRERQQLADLTGTLISYSLTYRQERGQDGQYTYVLDPNVEELTHFPGLPQKKQLSYSAKQLIAREVEVEKMRRTEKLFSGTGSESASTVKVQKKSDKVVNTVYREPARKMKPPTDFFGRAIEVSSAGKSVMKDYLSSSYSPTHPLWFKFNEGYSNAVRKPVRIQDLL